MPILTLQKRARELGRIRIGQKGDRGQPQKLDRFRLTSYSKPLLDRVAELYGGTVQEWTPAGGAAQWEIVTDASRLPILVPPQPVSQFLETWTAAGCVHRCDGETNWLTGEPCDLDDPNHVNARPTTRLKVVLRDVEGVGVWRLESHGWNAAAELPDAAVFLAQAGGYIEGWVALEERVQKRQVNGKTQTQRFMVPIIEINVTPAELMAGRGRVTPPSVEGPVAPKAIEAAAIPDYVALAKEAGDLTAWREIWELARKAGHLTDELKRDLTAVGQSFNPAESQVAEDPEALWFQIMQLAGEKGMTEDEMNEDFVKVCEGVTAEHAGAADMQRYLDHLRKVTR